MSNSAQAPTTRVASSSSSWGRRAIGVCCLALVPLGCGDDDDPSGDPDAASIAPTSASDEVSLTGTWTGDRERIMGEEYHQGSATLTVTEQNGLTFSGTFSWTTPTGEESEAFVGGFTPGGGLISGADDEGTLTFELVDSTTLDYCYTRYGDGIRVACGRLDKQE